MTRPNGHDRSNIAAFPGKEERKKRGKPAKPPSEPFLNLPPAAQWLSLAIIATFGLQKALALLAGPEAEGWLIFTFGFVPARYTGELPLGGAAFVAPLTHMFLHGGWLHAGINILSLLAFGAGLEKWTGVRRFLLVYFVSGLAGAVVQLALSPGMVMPMIGASGAISGAFGAMLIEFQRRGHMAGGVRSILPFVLLWVGSTVFFGAFGMPGAEGAISWATHVGGFFTGMAIARFCGKIRT